MSPVFHKVCVLKNKSKVDATLSVNQFARRAIFIEIGMYLRASCHTFG
jgi:hypothetical protein